MYIIPIQHWFLTNTDRQSRLLSLSLSLRRFFLPSPPPHSIRLSPVKTEEIQPCWKHLPHPLLLYHPHYHKRHQFSEKRGTKYNWCCCGVGGVTVSLKGIIWHRVGLLFFFYIEGGLLGWTSDSLLDICWENWIYWNYYYWKKSGIGDIWSGLCGIMPLDITDVTWLEIRNVMTTTLCDLTVIIVIRLKCLDLIWWIGWWFIWERLCSTEKRCKDRLRCKQ